MSKRTWQPKQHKRLRKHGFLTRTKTQSGRAMLKRRQQKGRAKLAVTLS